MLCRCIFAASALNKRGANLNYMTAPMRQQSVMYVISAEDLQAVIADVFNKCERDKQEAIATHREMPVMTRQDVCRVLNVNYSTLWRWAKDGYLVPVKIGTKVFYRPTDVDAILYNRKSGAQ